MPFYKFDISCAYVGCQQEQSTKLSAILFSTSFALQYHCRTISRSVVLSVICWSLCVWKSVFVQWSTSSFLYFEVWWWVFLSHCLVISLPVPLSSSQPSSPTVWRSAFLPYCLAVSLTVPQSGGHWSAFLSLSLEVSLPAPLSGDQSACSTFWQSAFLYHSLVVSLLVSWPGGQPSFPTVSQSVFMSLCLPVPLKRSAFYSDAWRSPSCLTEWWVPSQFLCLEV